MGQRGEATPGRCYCDLHAVLLCFTGRDIVFHVAAAGEEADLSRARPRVPRRNIPTRVGRIAALRGNGRTTPEHPHARGENWKFMPKPAIDGGTSPRAWGECLEAVLLVARDRNIPTRVGRMMTPICCAAVSTEHPHARGENGGIRMKTRAIFGTSPRAWGE